MRSLRILLTAFSVCAAIPAAGHHSPAAFDLRSTVTVTGEVTRFDWRNPHVYVVVEGVDDRGQAGEWVIETDPTPLMVRSGWTAATLKPGDSVSVRIRPDRDPGTKHGLLVSLTRADGRTFGVRSGEGPARNVAGDISGVWDGLGHFSMPFIDRDTAPERRYTAAGLAARAAYDRAQYPPAACLPFATPVLAVLPYLNEIEVLDDRVLLRSEFYGVERTIYTDGRGHPDAGPRTIQGHSIGHWEGAALVVDTRLFADFRVAHGPGVPSGAQKHTVERFELSADGSDLNVEIDVEDPEFVEPYTISTTWDYAPDRQLQPFACDSESARVFLSR